MSDEISSNINNNEDIPISERYRLTLLEKLDSLPITPGCYLMKNERGEIIYIGKAKVLRNRVRQYFQKGSDLIRRTRRMVYEIKDLEWIITDSELEALILESNLIKKHKPVYNVRLRDDKSYPYISITLSEEWPRIVFVRKLHMKSKEADKYFGPYTDSLAVKDTIRLIRKIFRIPCGYKNPEQSKGKACMYYHIKQCLGPCCNKVTKEEYMAIIKDVIAFLEGRREELVDKMLVKMNDASENMEYEKAGKLRDSINSIQKLIARQKVISTGGEDQDIIALVTDNINSCVELFFIRGGKLIGQEHFFLENSYADNMDESLQGFILQYYQSAPHIPKEILLSSDIAEMDIVESWLRQKRGTKVKISHPQRGERKLLVEMAAKNAELVLRQLKLKMEADEEKASEELSELQKAAMISKIPRRIEAYDISNIQGHHTVASLVVFENGKPKKEHYRRFKLRRPEGMPDDYASMREVVTRRLSGSLRQTEAFKELPDLILIDGGKGQLSSALEAMEKSGVKCDAIGLAKQNEEIIIPGRQETFILPRSSKALRLLQRIRDEAHRFAITYHRTLRDKTMRMSVLNNIPGIGSTRKKALIKHFGSIDKIKLASIEELEAVPDINKPSAKAVFEYFRSE